MNVIVIFAHFKISKSWQKCIILSKNESRRPIRPVLMIKTYFLFLFAFRFKLNRKNNVEGVNYEARNLPWQIFLSLLTTIKSTRNEIKHNGEKPTKKEIRIKQPSLWKTKIKKKSENPENIFFCVQKKRFCTYQCMCFVCILCMFANFMPVCLCVRTQQVVYARKRQNVTCVLDFF